MDITPPVVGALVGAVATAIFAWLREKGPNEKIDSLEKNLKKEKESLYDVKRRLSSLLEIEKEYNRVKAELRKVTQIYVHVQPVLLIGPRGVGKTSLLDQWNAPWDYSKSRATMDYKSSVIPFYNFDHSDLKPHHAAKDIKCKAASHLRLKVFDFPGELKYQEKIIEVAMQKHLELRESTGKNLGIVLVCLLDASDATKGESYYCADLYAQLWQLVSHHKIKIEKMVLVLNKYDLLTGQCEVL
jgi:GTP1/Obg family GTP-binding protein